MSRWIANYIRRGNAFISLFFHIPYPEQLPDDVWFEKMRQIEWLAEKGLLGIKTGGKDHENIH